MSSFTEEQKLAITTIENNVAVSAGAGSGKTRVLVKRFVHILEQCGQREPVSAADILAITFTRKAAAEMKQRVREEIQDKITLAEKNAKGEVSLDEEFPTGHSAAFWREQLRALERAQISTIHSLCSRILRENPVEAHLDPDFKLAEDFTGQEFMVSCLQKYLRQGLRQENSSVRQLIQTYGFNSLLRQLESLLPSVQEILDAGALSQPYEQSVAQIDTLQQELCMQVNYLVIEKNTLTTAGSKGREKLDCLAAGQEKIIAAIKSKPADLTLLNAAVQGMSASGKLKEPLKKLRELQASLEAAYADEAALPLMPHWENVLRELQEFCRQQKQSGDLLTYDDLESLAAELLESNEQVRRKYHHRFRYLMVDEFQDTNERQRQLIYLLCGDDKNKLTGKKLFIVGDPKQSIYRFRGADVSVFAAVRREMEALGGSMLSLSQNFRSEKTILIACNKAFAPLLGEDASQDVYFESLQHFWDRSAVRPSLLLVPYDKEEQLSKYGKESRAVAQKIAALQQGLDGDEPVAYGKMAVLLRAMTHADELTQALREQGIPYKVIDGRGFYERQEVLDLLHLFTVLHNRCRSLELAGVLRSPYFGLSDSTITKLFLQGQECLWDAVQQADAAEFGEQGFLLRRAAVILASLRCDAALLALPELWQKVWHQLSVSGALSVQEHGEDKLANAAKLRTLSQEYSAAHKGQGTLGGWLDYVRRLREAQARETAANLSAEDAVQIMTIHKSKGLQFHTVILPMLDDSSSSDTSECKFVLGVGLGVKALLPNGSLMAAGVLEQAKQLDKQLELRERARLLYVAMTRAEVRLLLTGITNGKEPDEKKSLQELSWLQALQSIFSVGDAITVETYQEQENADNLPDVYAPVILQADRQLLEPLPDYVGTGQRQFSATSLQTYLYCQRQYFYKYVALLPELEQHTGPGAEDRLPAKLRGLVIHRALELYNGNAEQAWQSALEEHAPGQAAPELLAMLQAYTGSSLYQNLPQRKIREKSFLLPAAEGITIQGIIDCLAWDDNGNLLLVDYKTGTPPQTGETPKGYAWQLALYKYAAEQLLQKPVVKAQLHFLQNLSIWELPIEQADAYLEEALEICREIKSKSGEEAFACDISHCAHCSYQYLCRRK